MFDNFKNNSFILLPISGETKKKIWFCVSTLLQVLSDNKEILIFAVGKWTTIKADIPHKWAPSIFRRCTVR